MNRQKNIYTALYTVGAFFCARCMVFNMLCPVGSAYLALSLGHKRLWLALAAATVGVLSRRKEVYVWGYICAYVLLGLVNSALVYIKKEENNVFSALAGGFCALIGGIVYASGYDFVVYYVVLGILQSVLTALLIWTFREGIEYALHKRDTGAISLALLVGFACGGMDGISFLGIPISVLGITCLLPFLMAERVTENDSLLHIKNGISSKLWSFSDAMDRLSRAVSNTSKGDKNSKMLSNELDELSKLTSTLSYDVKNSVNVNSSMSKRVCQCLKKEGVAFESAVVYGRDRTMSVEVTKKQRESCERCTRNIVAKLNRGLGIRLTKSKCTHKDGFCTMELHSERPWRIAACAAVRKREDSNVSGDSHLLTEVKEGKYMLALSDGMGSGDEARAESAASVELFENFMEAGFGSDAALERINSLMLIKGGGEDIFATMDVCMVDLYTGQANFVKTGGMPGFVYSRGGIRLVGNGGLPIGIIEKTYQEKIHLSLKDGDIIVMVTDGVTEAASCEVNKEQWLSELIEKNAALPVETLAENIIEEAERVQQGKIRDDMTVIAAKVWRV